MSQAQLAEAADVGTRQIARYESGDSEPGLGVALRLAEALGISLTHLAGQIRSGLDLSGEWWAGWQNRKNGEEWIAVQRVEAVQTGDLLSLTAERTRPVDEGGYNWDGELRLWDNQALIGWYRAADGAVQSKGSMYFALQRHGTSCGRPVGRTLLRRPGRHRPRRALPRARRRAPRHQGDEGEGQIPDERDRQRHHHRPKRRAPGSANPPPR